MKYQHGTTDRLPTVFNHNNNDDDNNNDNSLEKDAPLRKTGTFFVSSGFDKNINIFSADDWALAKTLSGHSGNVLSVDVSADARWIASCGHDRTVKLWGFEDGGKV